MSRQRGGVLEGAAGEAQALRENAPHVVAHVGAEMPQRNGAEGVCGEVGAQEPVRPLGVPAPVLTVISSVSLLLKPRK